MTRIELMTGIENLIQQAGEENKETLAASASLMALLGAMKSGHDLVFLNHVSQFSSAYIVAFQKGGNK